MFIPIGDPMPPELAPDEAECCDMDGRPVIPIRCCWRARAFCIISKGRLLALGAGRLAVFKMPVTLELGLIVLLYCGSETVRRDGTLRGCSSGLELGGSSGVLASEDSSTEPGETGVLSINSSGVSGDECRWCSAMAGRVLGLLPNAVSTSSVTCALEMSAG